jgi:hypothetical protein
VVAALQQLRLRLANLAAVLLIATNEHFTALADPTRRAIFERLADLASGWRVCWDG